MGLIEAGTYQFPEKPQDHLVRVEQENSRLECSDQLAMPLLRVGVGLFYQRPFC